MILAGMGAGDKGVQPFDPVGEAMLDQEIERPIGDGRLRRETAFAKDAKDFVCAQRAMLGQKDLKHAPAHGRQLQPGRLAMGCGSVDARRDAVGVVMVFEADHSLLICYTITYIKRAFSQRVIFMRLIAILLVLALAPAANAQAPRVAADILPVHSLAARVMDGVGEPDLILPPGASPHGYAMRPSEAVTLENAGIVFWVGADLTPWLADPIQVLADDARHVALLDHEGTIQREADGHDHHGHDHGDHDPHAWLDPMNARIWLRVIADVLSEADPENAASYRLNADAAQAEVDTLIAEMAAALKPLQAHSYAVTHDAFGHLEDRFGMQASFAILSGDADQPGPKRIAELRNMAISGQVTRAFSEQQTETRLIQVVFDGLPVVVCEIDLLGTEIAMGPNQYWQSMRLLADIMGNCGA